MHQDYWAQDIVHWSIGYCFWYNYDTYAPFFFFFWSGLQGPNAYSLWYGVVPKPSIGEGDL